MFDYGKTVSGRQVLLWHAQSTYDAAVNNPARSLLLGLENGSAWVTLGNITSTWPPSTSASAGPPPL